MTSKLFNYLEGNLSEQERKTFEEKIEKQAHLKETVNLYKGIDDFLEQDVQLEAVKERVSFINDQYENEANKRRRVSFWITSGSVAASVIIVAGAVTLFNPFKVTPAKLYDKNYMAWEPRNVTRGAMERDSLTQWVAIYNEGNYKLAVKEYNNLKTNDKTQPQVVLMYACALMQQDDFQSAVKILNTSDLNGFSFFEDDFEWYKALCYIKLDKNTEAKASLNKLLASDRYMKKANVILKNFD